MLSTPVDWRERVRNGSTLELRVTSESGKLGCSADLIISDKPPEHWKQPQIHPGPKRKKLESPRVYMLTVDVLLLGQEKVDVMILIKAPDGVPHGEPVTWTLAGQKGDSLKGTLFVKTLRTE